MSEPITIELPDMVGGTVAVVTLKPGDTLVLTYPGHISNDAVEYIRAAVKAKLPEVECMVLGNGLSIDGVIPKGSGAQ